ncbi:MAG TPA: nitrous oxide reductase family maturation protein NosD [Gemmatimonadaceae bacterium]|nr:nitrous oxide reductase family maturation protein NosD [Gemmatimonadaceae bacterium]
MHGPRALVVAASMLALAACAPAGPRPIAYGEAECDYCRMGISDPRFGAEVVMRTGAVREFDSIECLVSYLLEGSDSAAVRSVWVADFRRPGTLVPAERARYLRAPGGPASPMGLGIVAVGSAADERALRSAFDGEAMDWTQVRGLVRHARVRVAAEIPHHAPDASAHGGADEIEVAPGGPVSRIGDAVRLARPGARILVRPGVYREPTILVDKPVRIEGVGRPTLDGEGARQIMTVTADDVTVRGLRFAHVGTSYMQDRAAIKVVEAANCAIVDNQIDDAFFGIYLAKVTGCRVEGNVLRATKSTEAASGNGIHLWSSREVLVERNRIAGHRDGIYLEFGRADVVRDNVSEDNLRYGMHFMYSDSCHYLGNTFRRNQAGVAVMYSKVVEMTGNRFESNWGSASYGLLLKEIADATVRSNQFTRNTVGLFADGASRIDARDNAFTDNGWAVKLLSSTYDGTFMGNDFIGNTFDVATNGRESENAFAGNYYDTYRGYDLDRDGFGDVPHRPVRLFSMIVERNAPTLILLRTLFVGMLDAAERVIPALTPETIVDRHPAMHPHTGRAA